MIDIHTTKSNAMVVVGSVTFENAMSVLEKGQGFIAKMPEISVDFSQLEKAESVLLAICVHWIRYCKNNNKEISFKNIPKYLQDLIHISGLEEYFN